MKPDNSAYEPHPIDLSDVQLDSDLLALTELIAENTHEVWAAGRRKEGWTYGPCRDDRLKQTPNMVPYSELPDSEKEYDRVTAMETLKAIYALGYKIVKD